jgi:glutamate-5-semialdehyde dehydrogenase
MTVSPSAQEIVQKAQAASRLIALADTAEKNSALNAMASLLENHPEDIVHENERDLQAARESALQGPLYERLAFDAGKVRGRINALKKIAALPDPVGQITDLHKTSNGLLAGRMRVPIGVLLMIYEARPHVTVNAGAFAIKSGNSIICKGGSEALHCNRLLGQLWIRALEMAGLPRDAVQVAALTHETVDELLTGKHAIDLVIPRGGKELIQKVVERSCIPVIKHFEGVCHVYIDGHADLGKALQIALDSKLLMPAVCNAAETLLVDTALQSYLPVLLKVLKKNGIAVHGCPNVCSVMPEAVPAGEDDWRAEYLDLVYAVRIVDGIDGAIEHINLYGSGHTDVIVTEHLSRSRRFIQEVNSAVVLVNASTMFCDGETLGMGGEIGISTDKFHARGPMGLTELTSYKHVILGEGQIMGQPYEIR